VHSSIFLHDERSAVIRWIWSKRMRLNEWVNEWVSEYLLEHCISHLTTRCIPNGYYWICKHLLSIFFINDLIIITIKIIVIWVSKSEWVSEWMSEWVSKSEWVSEWMNEWVSEWVRIRIVLLPESDAETLLLTIEDEVEVVVAVVGAAVTEFSQQTQCLTPFLSRINGTLPSHEPFVQTFELVSK
jgi:hypothetical protein